MSAAALAPLIPGVASAITEAVGGGQLSASDADRIIDTINKRTKELFTFMQCFHTLPENTTAWNRYRSTLETTNSQAYSDFLGY